MLEPKQDRRPIRAELVSEHCCPQEYSIGEEINLEGFRVHVWHSDMSIEEIDYLDDRIYVEGFDSSKEGRCHVSVYFVDDGIRECLYRFVAIIKKGTNNVIPTKSNVRGSSDIRDMYMLRSPQKTIYLLGEDIDLTGAVFKVTRNNGSYEYVTYNEEDFSYELKDWNNTIPSYQHASLYLTYCGKRIYCGFEVGFKERKSDKIVTKIEIIDYPKINNDEIDWSNALFQIEYDDLTSDFIEYDANHMNYVLEKQEYNGQYVLDLYYYEDIRNKDAYQSAAYTYCYNLGMSYDYSSFLDLNVNHNILDDRSVVKQNIYSLENLPSKYNLKNILNIKAGNQGFWGLCWDFAATKSLETNYYLKYGQSYDLSEKFADYLTSKLFYGNREETDGGLGEYYSDEMQITGVPTEEKVPYVKVEPSQYAALEKVEKVVQPISAITIRKAEINDNIKMVEKMVKSHVLNHGSMYVSVSWSNPGDENYFYQTNEMPFPESGHAIRIIGWDDTISKEKFTKNYNGNLYTPQRDGAWIALNSWGEGFGFDGGLFYISYDTDMSYFGFLDSKPYVDKKIYTYARDTSRNIRYYYDNEAGNKKYLYVEFSKSDKIEYLTNIILPKNFSTAKVYLLNDFTSIETADFSKLVRIGDNINYTNNAILDSNIILDNPYKLTGNKFLIVIEMDKQHGKYSFAYKLNDSNVHSYYSNDELSNEPVLLDGNLLLHAFTIDRVTYINQMNNEIDRVEISKLPTKATINIGQEANLAGGEIKIVYKNGNEEIKSMTDEDVYWYGVTNYDNNLGNKEIKVFYGDKFVSFNMELIDNIQKIEMNELPKSLYNYLHETDIDLHGGSIKVIYSDGTSQVIELDSPGIQISPDKISYDEPGTQEIEVEYRGYKTSFSVEVSSTYYTDFCNSNWNNIIDVSYGDTIDLSVFRATISRVENGKKVKEEIELNNNDYTITLIVDNKADVIIYSRLREDDVLPEKYLRVGELYIEVKMNELDLFTSFTVNVLDNQRQKVHLPKFEPFDYTGNIIEPELPGLDTLYEATNGTLVATGVGTYSVTLSLFDSENSVWVNDDNEAISSEPQTITWSIKKAMPQIKITGKVQSPSFVKEPTVTVVPKVTNGSVTITYANENSDNFTSELPYGEGKYKVKVMVKGDSNLYNTYVIDDFEIAVINKGDLDESEDISIVDVRLLLQRFINQGSSPNVSEKDLAVMDMNDDGRIDVIDVRLLLQTYINS